MDAQQAMQPAPRGLCAPKRLRPVDMAHPALPRQHPPDSGSPAKSRPVMELPLSASSSVKTPMARQMASAVSLLSPVMTTTRMPAAWQSSIAVRTCSSGTSSAIVKRELADVT